MSAWRRSRHLALSLTCARPVAGAPNLPAPAASGNRSKKKGAVSGALLFDAISTPGGARYPASLPSVTPTYRDVPFRFSSSSAFFCGEFAIFFSFCAASSGLPTGS